MSGSRRYDVVVVGGGMVGAAMTALLARCGFSVGLVEARMPQPSDPDSPVGLRVSALSPGSQAILDQAGAWAAIEAGRLCAYRRMSVEDRDSSARLEFNAPEHGLERLGTIVENNLVVDALWGALRANALVGLHCPANTVAHAVEADQVHLELEDGTRLSAGLLIGADGASSRIRGWLGAEEDVWDYNQKGLVCVVRKSQVNPGVAWQRFHESGPLAFLPLADGTSSIVWTLPAREADRLLEADDDSFSGALNLASEGWLGEVIECGPRAAFPLTMRLSDRYVGERLVLLGDAAHRVHPLAGQGVNLGLADAAALLETLITARTSGQDLGSPSGLQRFERWRRSESSLMAQGIHAIGGLFQPEELNVARRLGMAVVSRSWWLGDAFIRRAAGRGRNAPRLSRGEDLHSLLRGD